MWCVCVCVLCVSEVCARVCMWCTRECVCMCCVCMCVWCVCEACVCVFVDCVCVCVGGVSSFSITVNCKFYHPDQFDTNPIFDQSFTNWSNTKVSACLYKKCQGIQTNKLWYPLVKNPSWSIFCHFKERTQLISKNSIRMVCYCLKSRRSSTTYVEQIQCWHSTKYIRSI